MNFKKLLLYKIVKTAKSLLYNNFLLSLPLHLPKKVG